MKHSALVLACSLPPQRSLKWRINIGLPGEELIVLEQPANCGTVEATANPHTLIGTALFNDFAVPRSPAPARPFLPLATQVLSIVRVHHH
jgi:hypothetical protein